MKNKIFICIIAFLFILLFISFWLLCICNHYDRSPEEDEKLMIPFCAHEQLNIHSNVHINHSETTHKYRRKPQEYVGVNNDFAVFEIDHNLPRCKSTRVRDFSIDKALASGAHGMVTLFVVDVDGNPISDVIVNAVCGKSEHNYEVWKYSVATDIDGFASLNVLSSSEILIILSKEGYYNSQYKYSFYKHGYQCVEHGRWLPWNPTLEMTLKPIRAPEQRIAKKVRLQFPSLGNPYGFDCDVGDFVEPYGKGKYSDFNITFYSDATVEGLKQYRYTNEVIFSSVSSQGGFLSIPYDHYSQHPSVYDAPIDGYSSSLFFSYRIWGPGVPYVQKTNPFAEGHYIVFRSCVTDKHGQPTNSMRYGKILPFHFSYVYEKRLDAFILRFMYYYNLQLGDRNLEGVDDIWSFPRP